MSQGYCLKISNILFFANSVVELERYLVEKLMRELKDQMSYRFVLKGLPPESVVYICLWLMNSDVSLFTNCPKPVCRLLDMNELGTNQDQGAPDSTNIVKILYKLTYTGETIRLKVEIDIVLVSKSMLLLLALASNGKGTLQFTVYSYHMTGA
jgi:hypothetical protein